jgi:purine-binding chemotaxis protein CheW
MENLKSYLTFRIGSEHFAANASFVHNIIEIPQITEVPEMPEYMLGVINLRGSVLPVVDSRIKFGLKNREITSNSCIIVMEVTMEKKQVFIGYLVDSVSEVLEVEEKEIKDPPSLGSEVRSKFISGVFHDKDEKFVMILDMNKVLSESEIIHISSKAAAEAE